jgi:mycothiol synthase
MNEEFRIIPFDPLTADDALWEQYFDQTEAYYRESNPGEPMLPRAKKKEHSRASEANPYNKIYHFLALGPDGRACASAYILAEKPKSPTYAQNKHIGNLHGLSVLPACRRRGLGTALLRHVAREMAVKEPQFTELMVPSAMESGHRFLEKKGAVLSLEHGENRLYLKDADWALIERWDAEGAARNPGTAVLSVREIPEADLKDYARAYTETINQQPMGALNLRMEVTPEQIRYGEAKCREKGMLETTIYTREPDGRISGLTETAYLPDLPHVVRQMLTGVRKEYRGRGLGKLLKARMLLHIRRECPGVKYVATGNADSNAPMMAINTALGFKKHRPVLLYTLKIKPELLK